MALGVLKHLEHHPELDAVGVWFDFTWRGRQFLNGARIFLGLSLRGMIDEFYVGIGDGGLLYILVHRGTPLLVTTFEFQGHLGSSVVIPLNLLFLEDPRLVFLCIDLNLKIVGG